MALNPADLPLLSRLLDEALELPDDQIKPWLAALPPEHVHLAPQLLEMLVSRHSTFGSDFLAGGPQLTAADESVAHTDDRVGPYRLIREIGCGGMGSVWLAERADGSYQRQVALKLPRLAWGAGLTERMARERDIGTLLEHPAIARLYDAGVDDRGRPFLAFEYIAGQPIDAWCEAQALDTRARLLLFVQVARAVAYAHGRLVVHRDLKPSNVMVTAEGQVRLLDFGIAKLLTEAAPGEPGLTQEQGRVLTPQYASPEQIAGETITVQSDVYSLGALLYELLTGVLPHAAKRATLGAMEDAILEGDAPLASSRIKDRAVARALRGEVDAILGKAMQRQAAKRYATADALAEDIEQHLKGEAVAARPASWAYRMRKAVRRHWVALSAAVAVAASLAVGGTATVLQSQRATQQAERARMATQFVTELFRVGAKSQQPDAYGSGSMLEQGASLIVTRFPGQPDMQAELFGAVGQVYADLGANRAAIDYVNRELRLLEDIPLNRDRRARAFMLLARSSMDDGMDDDAERAAADAVQSLSMAEALWADAHVLQARVHARVGKRGQAREAVIGLERALIAAGRSGSPAMAWTLWLKGDLTVDDWEARMALRRTALDMVLKSDGPTSADAIEMQLMIRGVLTQQGRLSEAAQYGNTAFATLRSIGGVNSIRAAVEEAFDWGQRCGMDSTLHDEAIAAIERNRQFVAVSRVPPDVPAEMDRAMARCHLNWGLLDKADRLYRSSEIALVQNRQSLGMRWEYAGNFGRVNALLGRHTQANLEFNEKLQLQDRMGKWSASFIVSAWAWPVMNRLMHADLAGARETLLRAPVLDTVGAAADDQSVHVLQVLRARLSLEEGNAERALSEMPALASGQYDDDTVFSGHVALAEIQCALGQQAAGLQLLMGNIAHMAPRVSDRDVGLARIRATAGLCALAIGRRKQAAELALAARKALDSHSSVSPWFSRPVKDLELRLSSR